MKLRPEPSNIIQFPRAEGEATPTVRVNTEKVETPRVIVKFVETRYEINSITYVKASR